MQAQAPRFVAEMEFEKSTKRTFRFKETTPQQNLETLYVQQRASEKQPKHIRVTVEVIE
jgi:hypothetical protein